MNLSLRRLRLLSILAAALLALTVAGCGEGTGKSTGGYHKTGVSGQLTGHEVADADNDGTYVEAGGITYQLEISRLMNPWGIEDSEYLKGLPAGTSATNLPADQLWFGVFLWAKNQHHRALETVNWNDFKVVDTMGDTYYPVKLDSGVNPYAWTNARLQFGETEPGQDSTAANGWTGGKIVLFKLNYSIYENRPLTLYILSPTTRKPIGEISLDL